MATFPATDEQYALIGADLIRAERYLSRLKQAEAAGEDSTVREALTMAAIVSYCRPFKWSRDEVSAKKRWIPDALVKDLPDGCQTVHAKLEAHRDQAWAHTDWMAHQPRRVSSSDAEDLPPLVISRNPWVPLSSDEIFAFERLLREVNARIVPNSVGKNDNGGA
jgi:hypothetical protein